MPKVIHGDAVALQPATAKEYSIASLGQPHRGLLWRHHFDEEATQGRIDLRFRGQLHNAYVPAIMAYLRGEDPESGLQVPKLWAHLLSASAETPTSNPSYV